MASPFLSLYYLIPTAHDPTEDLLFPRQISGIVLLPSFVKEAQSMQISDQESAVNRSLPCLMHKKHFFLIFSFQ